MGRRKKEVYTPIEISLEEKEQEILENPTMGFDEKPFRLHLLREVGVYDYISWIEGATFLGGKEGTTLGVKSLFHKDAIENRILRLHERLSLKVVLLEKKRSKK